MPNFTMCVHRPDGRMEREGLFLANAQEAYDAAINDIRGIICDDLVMTGMISLDGRIEVESEETGSIFTVHFHEAMETGTRH